ncbi:HU family DNA-binding protein [Listeria innocua]|nr:HU family DNA-binding protein [Listeria innocua]MWW19188.1 HU family DNA-binding protein [Listeria monocytogenes]QPQ97771.1 HU family DNA-binding protein [Listeria welshimeri]EED2111693.1 HU family DNA-binding protein [Listeria innocua]EED2355614.1 HU family DNA-binding protein [Listeria innocua]
MLILKYSVKEVKNTMANKTDLVNSVAELADLSKKDAAKAVEAVFETIQTSLSKGEKVQLIGFGNFEVRERAARKGRNPRTKEEIDIPASKVPAFKPGKALKEAVK